MVGIEEKGQAGTSKEINKIYKKKLNEIHV